MSHRVNSRRLTAPDRGTQERWTHSDRVYALTQGGETVVARAMDSTLLDRLYEKGLINARLREAGCRLKGEYHAAGMTQHLSASYKPHSGSFQCNSPFYEKTDEEEDAYSRWRGAIKNVGPKYSNAIISAICQEESPRSVEELYIGLKLLAQHYQL